MAKDPAFLFYSSDFLVGTYTMTDEQVGQYVRLMCLQHQQGHLTEDIIQSVCKMDNSILSKFKIDAIGRYYNERLDTEIKKRAEYSASRSRNRQNRNTEQPNGKVMSNICSTHDEHMENENEDVNVNRNEDVNGDTDTGKKGAAAPARTQRGEYGWVKLTDEEYARLQADLGEAELARCIRYVDESAQGTGNKNKWKDWALIIRRCARNKWGVEGTGTSKRKLAFQDYDQGDTAQSNAQELQYIDRQTAALLAEARELYADGGG